MTVRTSDVGLVDFGLETIQARIAIDHERNRVDTVSLLFSMVEFENDDVGLATIDAWVCGQIGNDVVAVSLTVACVATT